MRNMKKDKKIMDCWSFNGKIFVKTLDGKINDVTDQARSESTWSVSF